MDVTKKKLLIFDFDGTLIDSVPDLALSINYMLRELGFNSANEETIHTWVGNGAQTLVRRALTSQMEIFDAVYFNKALTIFLNYYAEHACIKTRAYPHVASTLKALHLQGYTMAIVTNKPFRFIEPILKGLALDEYFDYHVGADSLEKKKPEPEPLLHVCQKLNVPVENSLMIGDSKNDILAAKNANMDSVGVTYGYNYGEDITLYEPDIVIDDFSKMLELF